MATTASADFCTPFSRGCPVDSRSRQACRPPAVSRCVLGDRPCRIYRRAVPTSIGHLDLVLDCPPHNGLVSGSCSSGLKLPSWSRTPRRQRAPSLPSDSASRPTPLLRRMVPLVAVHRGLAPPKHTTCVAHTKGAPDVHPGLLVFPRPHPPRPNCQHTRTTPRHITGRIRLVPWVKTPPPKSPRPINALTTAQICGTSATPSRLRISTLITHVKMGKGD